MKGIRFTLKTQRKPLYEICSHGVSLFRSSGEFFFCCLQQLDWLFEVQTLFNNAKDWSEEYSNPTQREFQTGHYQYLELDADPTYVDYNSHNSGPCNDVFEYKCYLTSLSLPLYSIQTPISAPLTSLELMARSCITPYPQLGHRSTAKHRITR